VCSLAGFCWEDPIPSGNNVFSIYGFSPTDVFQGGAISTVARYDGLGWKGLAQQSGGADYFAVWGADDKDVWAVGQCGTIAFYNGTAWIDRSSTFPIYLTWHGLTGTSTSDIWAAGDGGTILHYNGTTWTQVTSNAGTQDLYAIYAIGTEVWAVGGNTVVHYIPGTGWVKQTTGIPASTSLYGVWASDTSNIWAVGTGGAIYRGNASMTTWTLMSAPIANDLYGVWGSSPNNVWIVGDGQVAQWNGTTFNPPFVGVNGCTGYNTVWGDAAGNIWVGGNNGALLYKASGSTGFTSTPNVSTGRIGGVYASSATDVWVDGDGGVLDHYDGTNWTSGSVSPATSANLNRMWGTSPTDIWAVGSGGTALHYTGSTWTNYTAGAANLLAIGGSGSNDVWAAGMGGAIEHWTGPTNGWQAATSPTTDPIRDIWVFGPGQAVAVGGTALAGSKNAITLSGSTWSDTTATAYTNLIFHGVWGTSPTDYWVVASDSGASNGQILHNVSGTWTLATTCAYGGMLGIRGTGTLIYAVGFYGQLMTWNGGLNWNQRYSGSADNLISISMTGATGAWLVGDNGNVLGHP
jgi:hypothetical protein